MKGLFLESGIGLGTDKSFSSSEFLVFFPEFMYAYLMFWFFEWLANFIDRISDRKTGESTDELLWALGEFSDFSLLIDDFNLFFSVVSKSFESIKEDIWPWLSYGTKGRKNLEAIVWCVKQAGEKKCGIWTLVVLMSTLFSSFKFLFLTSLSEFALF